MCLRVVDVLQAVFEPAQEFIRLEQLRLAVERQQAARDEQRQHLERWPDLQRRVAAAANQLEDLGHELDFADAAGAELDVVGHVLARDLAADLSVQVAHGIDRAKIEVLAEDEGARDAFELGIPGCLQVVAGVHDARLDPGVTLPLAALGDQVVFERDDRAHERPGIAIRPQTHVDAKDLAIAGDLAERADQPLAETGEEVVGLDLAPAAGHSSRLAVFRVDEDVVDVRRDVQLAPAELAHADHQHPLRPALLVERFAKLGGELPVQEIEGVVGRAVGQLRHRFDDFGERHAAADVAHGQGRHDALAKSPQSSLQAFFVVRRLVLQKLLEQRRVQFDIGVIVQPVDDLRTRLEQLAQIAAVRQCALPLGRKRRLNGGGRVGHVFVPSKPRALPECGHAPVPRFSRVSIGGGPAG